VRVICTALLLNEIYLLTKFLVNTPLALTGQIHEIHGGALLGLASLCLDDLVEDDGDDRVGSTAGRVHVRRGHCTRLGAWWWIIRHGEHILWVCFDF